jgi:hypothetical protein
VIVWTIDAITTPANLPAQCGHNRSRVFASHLDQGSKTRMTLHQRRDVTVFCATNEIAFPMTRNGAVLDFSGPFPNVDGIYDLTARVFKPLAEEPIGSRLPFTLNLTRCA